MTDKSKVLTALVEKPSKYHILVIDNSMLPDKMKERETVTFVIKPPTLTTLSLCAIHLQDLPVDILQEEAHLNIANTLPHIDTMVKVVCIICYGGEDYPKWNEEFIKKNCTPQELFGIFHETSFKMKTDFFLTSFQIANMNPMMMRIPKMKEKSKVLSGSTLFK